MIIKVINVGYIRAFKPEQEKIKINGTRKRRIERIKADFENLFVFKSM